MALSTTLDNMTAEQASAYYAAEQAAEDRKYRPTLIVGRWSAEARMSQDAANRERRNRAVRREDKVWTQNDIDGIAAVCAMLPTD